MDRYTHKDFRKSSVRDDIVNGYGTPFNHDYDMPLPPRSKRAQLHVISVISNPRRYRSRYALYKKFEEYVAASGAILTTVEMAFGDRPFEVTDHEDPRHIQVRCDHELWHKENLVNIGLSRLPHDWEYVAWVDADITFARPDWVKETVEMLQHHDVVQMFSCSMDLGPNFEPFNRRRGFVVEYLDTGRFLGDNKRIGGSDRDSGYGVADSHPGYAWAARREAIDALGGLLEIGIVGAGDHHMATSLIGKAAYSLPKGVSEGYRRHVLQWEQRAKKLRHNVGFIDGLVIHQWHGKKKDRRYHDRWKILLDNGFDPDADLIRNSQGLLQLSDRSIGLRDGIRNYFKSRSEDSTDM